MSEQTHGPLERLLTLYRGIGTVRSLLDRKHVSARTKDEIDQARMLDDWRRQLSSVIEQLGTGSGGALAAPAGPLDWQPIETASKDGRWIWVKRTPSGRSTMVESAFKWDASHDSWFAGTGWWPQFPSGWDSWRTMTDQPAPPAGTGGLL